MASKIRKFKHTFTNTPLNSAPVQSAEIQTSLLQVGMRVRKSIGQGYRTQWSIEEEKLRSQRLFYRKHDTVTLWEDKIEQAGNEGGLDGSSSSQNSSESASSYTSIPSSCNSMPSIRRKRSCNTEEEKEYDNELMDAISTHLRPIAQATSRRKLVASKNLPLKDSENVSMLADFEDAIFLDPRNHCSIER